MPTRSPRTAVMTFEGAAVVLTVGVVVDDVGTLVGAFGSATDPIHGNGPSDACGSRSTTSADAFLPLPAATTTPPMTRPRTRAITTPITTVLRLLPPPDAPGAMKT